VITFLAVAVLAVLAFAYAALPLISSRYTDPLPDDSDPVLTGLEEEKAALLRAIAELDLRTDLAPERREQLRTRYEAKAAATIKALDARRAELEGRGRKAPASEGAPRKRRAPVAAIAVLGFAVLAAAFLPSYVLPRVGVDSNVTTTDVEAARAIRELRQAVDRDPTPANLMALGDAYLTVGQVEDARDAYVRAAEVQGAPLEVFQRLTLIALQTDIGEAQLWLERAVRVAPDDTDTLFMLSEVAYANGDAATSEQALRRYVGLLGGAPNETVAARLELFERADDLRAAADADPSEENLLALADLYWRAGDARSAATLYVRVLTEMNGQEPVALSRMGVALLASGAPSDAAALLERAASVGGGVESLEPEAQLSLGEAYVQTGRFGEAVTVIQDYKSRGGSDPVADELLAMALQGQGGSAPSGADLGAAVFASSCAQCHGASGEGGLGGALAGNPRAADEANVRDAVTFGRGMMPGFGATLQAEELQAVVAHVVEVVSQR
jgi:tetratricopeptide (TPR) repeat protein